MRGRQPDVQRNDTRLDAKTQEEQQEDRVLLAGWQPGCQRMKRRKIQSAARGGQDHESNHQKTRAGVGHDQKKSPGGSGFRLFMFEGDQAIRRKRHHFPRQQEEKCVGGSKDERQTEEQNVVEESENADVPAALPVPQITQGKHGDRQGQETQRQAEAGGYRIKPDAPGK